MIDARSPATLQQWVSTIRRHASETARSEERGERNPSAPRTNGTIRRQLLVEVADHAKVIIDADETIPTRGLGRERLFELRGTSQFRRTITSPRQYGSEHNDVSAVAEGQANGGGTVRLSGDLHV